MKISHEFDIHFTIALDPALMRLLVLILGDEEDKVAKATAILKEHTDNLKDQMSSAAGSGK